MFDYSRMSPEELKAAYKEEQKHAQNDAANAAEELTKSEHVEIIEDPK